MDQHTKEHDEVVEALDDVIEAGKENLERDQEIVRRASALKQMRAQGLSYREIVKREAKPLIAQLISMSLLTLGKAGGRFRAAKARRLHAEGMSVKGIADLFGVSHQRISTLLGGGNGRTDSPFVPGTRVANQDSDSKL